MVFPDRFVDVGVVVAQDDGGEGRVVVQIAVAVHVPDVGSPAPGKGQVGLRLADDGDHAAGDVAFVEIQHLSGLGANGIEDSHDVTLIRFPSIVSFRTPCYLCMLRAGLSSDPARRR